MSGTDTTGTDTTGTGTTDPVGSGELVVVTGMTGAGRSTAAKELEDLGYFVVDNLPPTLVRDVVRLVDDSRGIAQPIAVVVDVREPYEREAGHIEGTRHIELERLASQAETLPRDRPIVFHCRLGARSAMAAQAFRAAGYDAWSMAGGLERWNEEGRPVAGGGEVADH